MHEHSLTESDDSLTCFTTSIDWPYELVYAEAQVVPLGKYNPLEQATIHILGEFKDHPPSLEEAAKELGVMDPVFIESTLRQMVEKGILERTNTAGPLNFANCRINTGSWQAENKSPVIEKHGIQFCFDAATSEHIPKAPEAPKDCPANPVIEPNKLPAKRTHLGLEKARQWAYDQQEPFMSESSRMIEVTVLPDRGKYVWQSLSVACFTDHDGSLQRKIERATEQQQQWLDQLDIKHPLFQKIQMQDSGKRHSNNELNIY